MDSMILTLHIIVCVVLVVLVLLQSGKEGMGVIFGGGSGSLFGGTGAGGMLVKLTAFVGAVFIATSLTYNVATSTKVNKPSVIPDLPIDAPEPAKPQPPAGVQAPKAAGQNASGAQAPAAK